MDCLLNHLVRAQQQRLWNSDSERLCGFQVDHQVEFSRLVDGEIIGAQNPQPCRP